MHFDAQLLNTLVSLAIGTITLGTVLFGFYLRFRKRIKIWKAKVADIVVAVERVPGLISDTAAFRGDIDALKAMANRVQSAVLPNGGNSIPDRLGVIAVQTEFNGLRLEEHGKTIEGIGQKVDGIGNTMRAVQNTNPKLAMFDTDAHGRCTYVSRTYLRWTGLSLAEMLGWGWLNAIHPLDRGKVREEWAAAVADGRRFQLRYRLITVDGEARPVEGSAEPIPDSPAPTERWVGQIICLEEGD